MICTSGKLGSLGVFGPCRSAIKALIRIDPSSVAGSSVPKAQPYVSPGWSDVRNERRVTLGLQSGQDQKAPTGRP